LIFVVNCCSYEGSFCLFDTHFYILHKECLAALMPPQVRPIQPDRPRDLDLIQGYDAGPSSSHHVGPARHRLLDVANSVVLIGGVSYAGYRMLRSWILPRFFDVPDPAEEANRQMLSQV
jgi:hypothetical protein